jgi:hypothetical protein
MEQITSVDNAYSFDDDLLSINNKNLQRKGYLNRLNDVLIKTNNILPQKKVFYGSDLNFSYFDPEQITNILEQINNQEFKTETKKVEFNKKDLVDLNIYNFVNSLNQYIKDNGFGDSIEIEINFNTYSDNECKLIHRVKRLKKYDLIVKIFSNHDLRCYEVGFDYSDYGKYEMDSKLDITFDEFYESRRFDEISSSVNMDNYYFYSSKEMDFKNFFEKFTFETLVIVCSFKNDDHLLAKIIYYGSSQSNKNIKMEGEHLGRILNHMKEGKFDLKTFFEKLRYVDKKGKPMEWEKFITHLEDDFDIKINFETETNLCDTKYLEEVINVLDTKSSNIVLLYRKIYSTCLKLLTMASKEIIRLTNKNNQTKDKFSEYIEINFL